MTKKTAEYWQKRYDALKRGWNYQNRELQVLQEKLEQAEALLEEHEGLPDPTLVEEALFKLKEGEYAPAWTVGSYQWDDDCWWFENPHCNGQDIIVGWRALPGQEKK